MYVCDRFLIIKTSSHNRLLSEVKIHDQASLHRAIEVLHRKYGVPHVVITSLPLPLSYPSTLSPEPEQSHPPPTRTMSVVGSTMTSDRRPRPFRILFSVFDCYFSGTGDMFAALMVTRMREAVHNASSPSPSPSPSPSSSSTSTSGPSGSNGPEGSRSWLSPDDVEPLDLPLARAAEKVLASMHEVLERTCKGMSAELRDAVRALDHKGVGSADDLDPKTAHLLRSRAAELKLSRNLACLRNPRIAYHAEKMI